MKFIHFQFIGIFLLVIVTDKVRGNSLRSLEENEVCTTVRNESGRCVELSSCPFLKELSAKLGVYKDLKQLLTSQCGFNEDSKPLICCPESPLPLTGSCKAPNINGKYTELKQCPLIYQLSRSQKCSEDEEKLLQFSLVTSSGLKKYVCCPTTESEDTSSLEGQPCLDFTRQRGECIPVKKCDRIISLLLQKPISPKNKSYIRGSQCGYRDGMPFVCCAEESGPTTITEMKPQQTLDVSSLKWMDKLKRLLPQAPDCGPDAQDRIFGGNKAGVGEFPWAVLIKYDKPNNRSDYHCGGSLINEQYVITAAHCFKKIPKVWKPVSVRIRETNLETVTDCDVDDETFCSTAEDIDIDSISVHESYNHVDRNQHYDIALLKLKQKIQYDDFARPICLPLNPTIWNSDFRGHTFDITGWGKTETKIRSDAKIKLSIPFMEDVVCSDSYSSQGKQVIDSQICAGGVEGKDSCNGDSGGPLMQYYDDGFPPHWYLVGVVSYGPKVCGTDQMPGVYTRVSKFLEWISDKMEA